MGPRLEKVNRHDHAYTEIALVINGKSMHVLNGRKMLISRGDLLIIHRGETHGYEENENLELINIIFDENKLSMPLLDAWEFPLFEYIFSSSKVVNKKYCKLNVKVPEEKIPVILKKIESLDEELLSFRPGSMLCGLGFFIEILVALARFDLGCSSKQNTDFIIGDVVKYMNCHYEKKIPIENMCAIAHMSRRSLFRYFKNSTGCTPIEYLTKIRINNAAVMLRESKKTLCEIALECGFCDSNFFSKTFLKLYQTSPSAFRKKYLKK